MSRHHQDRPAIALLKHCLRISKTVDQLKQSHALILKTLPEPNPDSREDERLLPFLLVKLLRVPGDNLRYARYLFDEMPHGRTQFLWASLVRAHVAGGHFTRCIFLYARMHRAGVSPSAFVFSSVLNACARAPALSKGKQVHARVLNLGFLGNKIVETALLDMYAKSGAVSDARSIFDDMGGKDVVTWTAMIRGYSKLRMMEDARQLFDALETRNDMSWTTMVAGYANCGDMNAARELYDKMPGKNCVTWVAMIAGYGKIGDVTKTKRVFDEAQVKDAACWAAMLSCYAQNGYAMEALEMYREMRKLRVKINDVAVVGAISACTQLADIKMANELAVHVEETCCRRTNFLSGALINMHSRCGNIDQAQTEFRRMKNKDVISYSSMIRALSDHGKGLEALELFQEMLKDGVKPNHITFVSVLSACSHAGLVEEGLMHFSLMTKTFGIEPLIEHYSTIIDLLGRAGQLEKAYDIVIHSQGVCDAGVWGALLGACRVHGNVELGEMVARKLFAIEPENTGNYMLLADIYASVNRWEEAEKVKGLVSERGLRKLPGSSCI
ncbi:hypothetical protein ACJRO7_005602 [Eucalyptus globulus]|uniref:Pentatricopeptide repeat-containing protein n=1 Tax=Eucalyptus globulus TaxID=34317 RepID=A0ABD3J347_EUCGL